MKIKLYNRAFPGELININLTFLLHIVIFQGQNVVYIDRGDRKYKRVIMKREPPKHVFPAGTYVPANVSVPTVSITTTNPGTQGE